MAKTRPFKYTAKQTQKLIDKFFADADAAGDPYTVTGLCLVLDVERETLLKWQRGSHEDDSISDMVKKAKLRIQNQMEKNVLLGKGNTVFTIFSMKANYAWKETSVVEQNTNLEISLDKKLEDAKDYFAQIEGSD